MPHPIQYPLVTMLTALAVFETAPAQVTARISTAGMDRRPPSPEVPAVTATATGPTTVLLSWGMVTNATGYRVYRERGQSYSWLTPAPITARSFTDPGVLPNATYQYTVFADFGATGPYRPTPAPAVSVTTPAGAQPTNFAAQMTGLGVVRLTWTPPPGAASLSIKESRWPTGRQLGGAVSSFTDFLPSEGAFTYQLYATYAVAGQGEVVGDLSSVPFATVNANSVCQATGSTGGGDGIPGDLTSLRQLIDSPLDLTTPKRILLAPEFATRGRAAAELGTTVGSPVASMIFLALNDRLEDILTMDVENGNYLGIGPDEVVVRLAIAVDWAKEIAAWNTCLNAPVATLKATQKNGAWVELRVRKYLGGTSTLVFRKPKLGGVWTDMFHFNPGEFWQVFGGKIVTFTWRKD